MSDLTDRIRTAQVHAGEQVVMDDLRKRGLLDKLSERPKKPLDDDFGAPHFPATAPN